MASYRPRRSALYMPGSNLRALEKAKTLDVDCVVFDLEDAVAPEQKDLAREQIVDAVKEGGYGKRELVLRINGKGSSWEKDDICAGVEAGVDAILVPKVNSAADLQRIAHEMALNSAPKDLKIWAMMETPGAILNAASIAACGVDSEVPLSCLVVGTNDLAKETNAELAKGRAVMVPWLMTFIAAARFGGVDILDGVYNAFDDDQGFAEECQQGLKMGMDGKTLIHPRQISACHQAFSPTKEDVVRAQQICAAFERPENASAGVIKLDGEMVERLHAKMARRTLDIHEAIMARSES
ncbi:MAG: CoA ester lyase [Rhodobacteraceae bacterium]|nr:CoA ester lyase [Paracoccaceae bacterium]